MSYLVLGASSYLGSCIYRQLKKAGENVLGTVHSSDSPEFVHFDIACDDMSVLLDEKIKLDDGKGKNAIVCISQCNIDKCYLEYEYSYNINVIKTKQLLKELQKRGYYTIWFSSEMVFDGKKGEYTEKSETNAINDYGRMKEEMEHFICNNIPDACIFRLAKCVGSEKANKNLFTEWQKQIPNGRIRCIKDNIISFVAVEDIYRACIAAVKNNLHGLFHVVGDKALSRKELAELFYNMVGDTTVTIEECSIDELPIKEKNRSENVSMKNHKIREVIGFEFTPMEDTIEKYIENNMEDVVL